MHQTTAPAFLSLIVPTRQRLGTLRRFLSSLIATTSQIQDLEVVLIVDEDDAATRAFAFDEIPLRKIVVPPGLPMGTLNQAGFHGSTGRWLMLLNDDVLCRTAGWDTLVKRVAAEYPDELLLVHVNDLVFREKLCTFPIVSRRFCAQAGGICPVDYCRYRIDDHIEDVFNLLGLLGERRSVYLPEVIFEHSNFVTSSAGTRQYFANPDILFADAQRCDGLRPGRKQLALRLKEGIAGRFTVADQARWRAILEQAAPAEALRAPERLRFVFRHNGWPRRLRACLADGGLVNLAQALLRRFKRSRVPATASSLPREV